MRTPTQLVELTAFVLTASLVPAIGPSPASAATTDLLFSEYVEGSSFNKAVEVYNGTGSDVDLSAYAIRTSFNGGTSVQTLPLSGTIADGDVLVAAHPDAVLPSTPDVTSAAVINFNGDDTVLLLKNDVVVDAIGQLDVDPGTEWGTGDTSTQDRRFAGKRP